MIMIEVLCVMKYCLINFTTILNLLEISIKITNPKFKFLNNQIQINKRRKMITIKIYYNKKICFK
jgi:hypothetical protein